MKDNRVRIIIAILVVLIFAAGFGGYFTGQRDTASKLEAEKKEYKAELEQLKEEEEELKEEQELDISLNRSELEGLGEIEGKIYVTGHKTPDTDTVGSAIGYAELLRKLGYDAEAVVLGDVNSETRYVLEKAGVDEPKLLENASGKNMVLVDHSDYEQSADGLEDANIISIVDHHGDGSVRTGNQLIYEAKPLGSAATIVWMMYRDFGLKPDKETALVMLGSIFSDTHKLQFNSTTTADKEAAADLAEIAGVSDLSTFFKEMNAAAVSYENMEDEKIFFSDYKEYEAAGKHYGIACVKAADQGGAEDLATRMKQVMPTALTSRGMDMLFVQINIDDGEVSYTYLVPSDDAAADIIEAAFGDKFSFSGTAYVMPKGVSRKSVIVPAITEALFARPDETTTGEETDNVLEAAADDKKDRPGAKWIDSGLFGAFEGRDDIRLQDDFAAYVNREWAQNVKINDGETNASARTEQSDKLNEEKLKLISGEKKDDEVLTSLQNFYHLLIDWDSRNASGLEPFKPYVKDVMGISSLEEYTEFLSDPNRNLFQSPMVENTVMINEEDAFSNILVIEGSKRMGYSSENYEGADKGEESELIQAYRQIVNHVLGKLGYSEAEAKDIFDRGLAFELRFLPAIKEFEEARAKEGAKSTTSLYTVKDIKEQFTNLPLCEIYKSLGYDLKEGPVRIMYPSLMKQFNELYTQDNLEGLKAWTLIHMIGENADYLDRETFETWNKAQMPVIGTDTLPQDDTYAMRVLNSMVPMMIDQVYVTYCFDKEIKPQVTELTDMIIDAYRDMLKEEDWLSDQTKAAAIEKLDHIQLNICYPDKLPNVDPLVVKSADENETLFEAVKAARRYTAKAQSDRILRRNDGTYWADDIYYSTLGASYEPSQNSINIHAGICGGDFYDPDWPMEKKLGGLCMVVGHEISHAFDSHGANFDKDGNHKSWWTEEDMARFQERLDKLNAYYSKLVPIPQISDRPYGGEGAVLVNGEATSDLASLKCLLSIAKKQKDFDYEMFFKQLAVIQKNARYVPAEKIWVMTDPHPLECYRCNIPVQNYDEFLETFHVKEGDGMYLAPEDRIRVW